MFYQKHIFVCTNQKDAGKKCCGAAGSSAIAAYMKEKLVAQGDWGPGKIRVTPSSCLGRCQKGPCVLVYPDNLWYRIENFSDADTILQHLEMGQPVTKLQILEEI